SQTTCPSRIGVRSCRRTQRTYSCSPGKRGDKLLQVQLGLGARKKAPSISRTGSAIVRASSFPESSLANPASVSSDTRYLPGQVIKHILHGRVGFDGHGL